ncbi:deoxyribose-phosphate aldolase [Maribacter algarum]|uniref:Deoxyribose-phosphate aldolase n=1 Tax=Maribacter algarum (ex Zhang et al. 2020) TaxID=2578118 RepID=A0A5S3PQB0_9FLAO|nr:DUF6503 family protein [Maribacter algarum]TMM56926.1 deoxyribose-phosphate aldolase [Maribacter algarum]
MSKIVFLLAVIVTFSCKDKVEPKLSAQDIVDKSIEASGGVARYEKSTIAFNFRDKDYISEMKGKRKILKRIQKNDTIDLLDILSPEGFERFDNDRLVSLHDSLSTKYGNSVNSVHYFSKLPYGLNDPAVQKELLGETKVKGKQYYKVKVTFNQVGGGDDFDDTYVYFFNKSTFKPDYLAYDFHVNGGGMRFREAYNERYVNGIRFVDYNNMKPIDEGTSVLQVDSLFNMNRLKLLSKIELKDVKVSQGSYN